MNCLVLENLSKYNPSKIQEIANRLSSSSKDIMLVLSKMYKEKTSSNPNNDNVNEIIEVL